jgi:hypothetical protein
MPNSTGQLRRPPRQIFSVYLVATTPHGIPETVGLRVHFVGINTPLYTPGMDEILHAIASYPEPFNPPIYTETFAALTNSTLPTNAAPCLPAPCLPLVILLNQLLHQPIHPAWLSSIYYVVNAEFFRGT